MLLRRFIGHFRQEDWFAVGVDLAVVVLGVFIGMQVDDWNTRQKEQREASVYIERLYNDAVFNVAQLEAVMENQQSRIEMGEWALDALIKGSVSRNTPQEAFRVVWGISLSSDLAAPSLSNGTYNELIASGDMRIIEDDQLKVLLQEVEGANALITQQYENFRFGMFNTINTVIKYGQPMSEPTQQEWVASLDYEGLAKDTVLQGQVVNNIGALRAFNSDFYRGHQRNKYQELLNYLACKLDKPSCQIAEDGSTADVE